MFPVAMLHGILQANDMVLDFFRADLRQSLAILEQVQKPAVPLAPFLAPMDLMRAMIPPTLPFPVPVSPAPRVGRRAPSPMRTSTPAWPSSRSGFANWKRHRSTSGKAVDDPLLGPRPDARGRRAGPGPPGVTPRRDRGPAQGRGGLTGGGVEGESP